MTKPPDQEPGDYEVGYGKPPVHTRFKPGNRAAATDGRPRRKKPRTIEAMVSQVLARTKEFSRQDGSSVTMSYLEAIVFNLVTTAQKPNSVAALRALKMLIELAPMTVEDKISRSLKVVYVNPELDRFDPKTLDFESVPPTDSK